MMWILILLAVIVGIGAVRGLRTWSADKDAYEAKIWQGWADEPRNAEQQPSQDEAVVVNAEAVMPARSTTSVIDSATAKRVVLVPSR